MNTKKNIKKYKRNPLAVHRNETDHRFYGNIHHYILIQNLLSGNNKFIIHYTLGLTSYREIY